MPEAHPRVSGENDTILTGGEGVQGSSPRERGKPVPTGDRLESVGLIPA